MHGFLDDIRHFARILRKRPVLAATAVSVLGLSIGANTAIFSVVNAVLLKPLPYPEPDRIVQLMTHSPQGASHIVWIPEFILWREQTGLLEDVAAYDFSGPGLNLRVGRV